MEDQDKIFQNLVQEMKRGSVVLAVLLVTDQPSYGYSLVKTLQEEGVDVEQNTLYPLLRRLETQGLMESSWDTSESRPRKFYQVTRLGKTTAGMLSEEWLRQSSVIARIIGQSESGRSTSPADTSGGKK